VSLRYRVAALNTGKLTDASCGDVWFMRSDGEKACRCGFGIPLYTQLRSPGNFSMQDNDPIKAQLDRALALLQLCRRLDYEAILDHQGEAVETLREVVQILRQSLPEGAQGDGGAAADVETVSDAADPDLADKGALLERQRRFVEALSRAGIGNRLGKLYCSDAPSRQVAFREAPHKLGLPHFDMVIAADYAPVSGYHGIFIGAQEVASCVLPLPAESHQWQIRERHRFADARRAAELVSLLSAGFPVA